MQLIMKKIELLVKLVFPRNLLGGIVPGSTLGDYMLLGLGDMEQEVEGAAPVAGSQHGGSPTSSSMRRRAKEQLRQPVASKECLRRAGAEVEGITPASGSQQGGSQVSTSRSRRAGE